MKYSREVLINYRISRAKESLAEAKLLAENGHWNTCINRLYYSCFYIVLALLLKNDLSAGKHSGVRAMLSLHFIKTGIVSKGNGRLYNELFDNRQTGDYKDLYIFDEETTRPYINKAEMFIADIEHVIDSG
ncbi:MAG: HEPN domain-containing protein [Bacteroidetes bacterium]|nr:HEPN domain-containing protein [Bacteroidota bacterium]